MPNTSKARLEYEPAHACGSGFRLTPNLRFKAGIQRHIWAKRLARGEAQVCRHGVVVTGKPLAPGTTWAPFSGHCVPVHQRPDGSWTWPAKRTDQRRRVVPARGARAA